MQLMTFNSLLMFDIVFVFFLFLVGVTCLVYYLPTGGGGNNKQHNHSHAHLQHHHDHESAGETVNCRYERHRLHTCPHHRISQLHQIHYGAQAVEVETEGTETETESESSNYPEQARAENQERVVRERLLIPLPPCRCSLSAVCRVCDSPGNRPGDCVLTLDQQERRGVSGSTVDLRLLDRHPTPHHRYCHRHSIRETDRCLHYVDDDDPDNDSSDEIFYCNDDNLSAMGVNGFGRLLGPISSPLIEHVVVNETESGAGSRQAAPLTTSQCCYIKAKFTDVKECVGPIADV